jgi:biopolymer transport protein TolQ
MKSVESVARTLVRATNGEVMKLERRLPFLATTGSTTPFIGLFGTVWGIMTAFQRIGAVQAANISVVAPGVSEALIATAAGLGAAIPAVIAYNHFLTRVRRLTTEMDDFALEFLNILERNFT